MSEEYVGWLDHDWNAVLDQSQPIVRCRDCKYYVEDDMECRENGVRPEPDGFCKWGERRES